MKKKWQMANGQWTIPKGFTLIEVLVALGLISIITSAIGVIITSSVNNVQSGRYKTLATKYAQEGIEAIRELRNKSYNDFKNYSGVYCLTAIPATLTSDPSECDTPNVEEFIRTVEVDQSSGCGQNIAKVIVRVSWSDGKCSSANPYCHTESHSTCLSTVNPIQAP